MVDFNIFDLSVKERAEQGIESLPGTLFESANYLEQDELLKKVLGTHVHDNILKIARAEWDAYKVQVHEWEIERYLNRT
jgi:glutamine synthetase